MFVFVLNKNGEPLMPCKPQKARKLLAAGKAKVVTRVPFTIKLTFGSSGYKQPLTGGMDTGSKHVGCAVIGLGKIVYQSQIALRQDVSRKMQQRAMYRRARNILAAGHAVLACGETVQSDRSMKQEPTEGIALSQREPVGIPVL